MSHVIDSNSVSVQCDTLGCISRIGVPRKAGEHVNIAQRASTLAAVKCGWAMSAFGAPVRDACAGCQSIQRAKELTP